MTPERWLPVPGWPAYEVSDLGNVRKGDRPITAFDQGSNHFQVWLRRGGERKQLYVHRLVLTAFVGQCPPGMQCRHLDGNGANNRLDNLRWGTPSENNIDQLRHGTFPHRKLTDEQVAEIRATYTGGNRTARVREALAARFGVTPRTIQFAVSSTRTGTWRHLP